MQLIKSTLGVIALGTAIMCLSSPAFANGNVYIDVPGFSLGYYDDHYDRHGYSKRYRHSNRYKYRSNRYYDDYRGNQHRRYNQHGYLDRPYYGKPYQHSYPQSYTICPDRGYSRYRIDRRYCYPHKDHFHCE